MADRLYPRAMTDENPATTTQDAPQEPAATETAPVPAAKATAPENGIQAPPEEVALLTEDPSAPWPYDGDDVDQDSRTVTLAAALPSAPATRDQQFTFLRAAAAGPHTWHQECLSLTRQAPQIPAGVPSARAAQLMVAPADRVLHVRDLRRGMAVYFDNPHDDNPFGHVDTVCGWLTPAPTDSLNDVLFVSSDVPNDVGEVGYVRGSFFPDRWEVPFVYGSRTLNGYYLPGYTPTAHVDGPSYRQTLHDAVLAVRRGIHTQRQRGHTQKVAALARDLRILKAQIAALG